MGSKKDLEGREGVQRYDPGASCWAIGEGRTRGNGQWAMGEGLAVHDYTSTVSQGGLAIRERASQGGEPEDRMGQEIEQ
jgi:hypothetical protein